MGVGRGATSTAVLGGKDKLLPLGRPARLSLHLVQPEPAAGEAYTMALGPRAAHSEASGFWLSSILDRKMMGVAFGFLCRLFTESSSSVAVTDKDTFDLSTFFDSNKALQHDRDELPEQRSVGGGLDVLLRPVGFGG